MIIGTLMALETCLILGQVSHNFLYSMNEIEVVASGLRLRHGAQLVVDVTLRTATTSCGVACTNVAHMDGADFLRVR